MNGLGAKLGSLERLVGSVPGRIIVVKPSVKGWGTETTPTGFVLDVPEDYAADPVAGLTPEQRAMIRDFDTIIRVVWVKEWRSGPRA
jgi:hypothetical protein